MRYTPKNLDQNVSPQSYAKKTATSDYNSMMLTDTTAREIRTLVHGIKEKKSVDIYDFSVLILRLTLSLAVLGYAHMIPTNYKRVDQSRKLNSKRSLDYVLSPFDIKYQPLDLPPAIPVSFQESLQFWNELGHGFSNGFDTVEPLPVEIKNGHITPDFSNGLDYPDPFLIVGLQAKRAAAILYSKELFFQDIPHSRAIFYNQEQRKRNGLSENKLGSLNPNLYNSKS
ncbi:hypothetical protein HHI36_009591 [Cryptolaemus montrouzieri]|uniref:Uncharacterized protein n=1 Tax=Cryptolaemus montrouzieri TaxID=559131 RepID=A0ABD2MG98_9CUCU